MKIVIVGTGNVGQELVAQLSKEGHDIVVVDQSDKMLEDVVNQYDVKGMLGNGASYDVLTEAGAGDADLLIACTPMDEMNILCCLVAKKLGAKDTIARVRTPEYFTLFKSKELGLSMMVNPEYETAMGIARILRYSSALKIEPFADGKVDLIEVKITASTGLAEVELKDLQQHFSTRVLICAVERQGKVYIPAGSFKLLLGDNIYLIASDKNISTFFREISDFKRSKKVIIVGGNRIAFYLTKELERVGLKVKIIENNPEKCAQLENLLLTAEIILGDGTDQELLKEEGLAYTDALIALCGIDEQNIILSMYAKSQNVKKVIARVDKRSYYDMLQNSRIDSVVSSKSSTADQIVRYARAKQNTVGSQVNKLYRIVNEQAEAIEFTVSETFKGKSIPLKNLHLTANTLVATIVRNQEIIIPSGEDTLESGDIVVIITTDEQLDDLNDILE